MTGAPDWQGALGRVSGATPFTLDGRVATVLGPIVESHGPQAAVGEVCRLRMNSGVSALPVSAGAFVAGQWLGKAPSS